MVSVTDDKLNDLSEKLNLILVVLLAEKGIPQKQIAKMLGISNKTLTKIFGKNYDKLLPKNQKNN